MSVSEQVFLKISIFAISILRLFEKKFLNRSLWVNRRSCRNSFARCGFFEGFLFLSLSVFFVDDVVRFVTQSNREKRCFFPISARGLRAPFAFVSFSSYTDGI